MTRAEREQLIERYLRGQMSPAEEHDFFIEVAGDKELRVDLKAYRIVDDALRKDRSADTATYSALRANMLTMIESRGVMPPAGQKTQTSPSAPAEMTGTTPVAPVAPDAGAGRWATWLGIGAVLLVLAGGLFLRHRSADLPSAAVPATPPGITVPAQPGVMPAGQTAAGRDAAIASPATAADSSLLRADTTLQVESPSASVAARAAARPSMRSARDRAPRRNDSTSSIRGGVRAGKSDSLKIQLIIQDPKKK